MLLFHVLFYLPFFGCGALLLSFRFFFLFAWNNFTLRSVPFPSTYGWANVMRVIRQFSCDRIGEKHVALLCFGAAYCTNTNRLYVCVWERERTSSYIFIMNYNINIECSSLVSQPSCRFDRSFVDMPLRNRLNHCRHDISSSLCLSSHCICRSLTHSRALCLYY